MHFNLSTAIIFATISISQATVLLIQSHYHQFLKARQSGPCDNACSTFNAALDRCTIAACLCSAPVQAGLQSCVNCNLTGNPSNEVIQTAQNIMDSFQGTCNGFGLSPVTIKVTPASSTPPVITPPVVTSSTPIISPLIFGSGVVVIGPGPVIVTPITPITTVLGGMGPGPVVIRPPAITLINTPSQTVVRPPSTAPDTVQTSTMSEKNGGFGLYQGPQVDRERFDHPWQQFPTQLGRFM